MTEKDEGTEEVKTPAPVTTPPADSGLLGMFEKFATDMGAKLDAAIEGMSNAVSEATRVPETPKETAKVEEPAKVKTTDADNTPGATEPKLHRWFAPIGSWGKS